MGEMPAQRARSLVELTLNTIRGLTIDAVQAANSGHPGMPMGAAAMGYVLFARHLRFDPEAPRWFDRDRYVQSAGHGSMLLYSLLYLTGYDLPLEELRNFRQWGSRTPGHPENTLTPGVEMATGPLGQGIATAVGMAIAEERLRAEFPELVGHHTYVVCSDGDLMEGVSSEAASLAGHLRLGRLVCLYDSNRITIDGSTGLAFTEDAGARFEAYGWHVLGCDGHDVDRVDACIAEAKAEGSRPTLVVCETTIGYGSPNRAGTAAAHGAALGEEEVRLTKEALGIPLEPTFHVPEEVLAHMREVGLRHRPERIQSESRLAASPEARRRFCGALPDGLWDGFAAADATAATRSSSGRVLNAIAPRLPELVGGSADLADSNNTSLSGFGRFSAEDRLGRNIAFGVREHAMACALNGMNLHGGVRAYGGTFLVFSDYMRPAIRLAALMEANTVFVFTHDSIGLGEDGPTHQPVEHLATLRAIPGLRVIRPADANETLTAWKVALGSRVEPTAIVLTRQAVPQVTPRDDSASRGAYVLKESEGVPEVILIGTGSEVALCLEALSLLDAEGVRARVVSMPCWELFESQPEEYRRSVLPPEVAARVSVEAASTLGWERWVGARGAAIGLERFGSSAPCETLFREFGFTPERVAEAARGLQST